jgi:protocatechuate 3,4-dioxygenase beta subunit
MDRRKILKYSAGGAVALAGIGAAGAYAIERRFNPQTDVDYAFPEHAKNGRLAPTPECGSSQVTLSQTEGPFYTPNTPLRTNLVDDGLAGTPVVIEGMVLDTECRPIPGAMLDFWSCDDAGIYDNEGFTLRGHQFADEAGRYRLETIRPGDYKAGTIHRTPHIHVKVQGPGTKLLTTQIYFPGEELNASDGIFNETLLVTMDAVSTGPKTARFDFVLA